MQLQHTPSMYNFVETKHDVRIPVASQVVGKQGILVIYKKHHRAPNSVSV